MSQCYSVREVARIFGLKESRLRYWAQTGFINPSGREDGKRAYTFTDLVEIKAGRELLDAGASLQRVRKALAALREAFPDGASPLSQLRVRSDGDTLLVGDEQATFNPISGQLLLDFRLQELDKQLQVLRLATANPPLTEAEPVACAAESESAVSSDKGAAPAVISSAVVVEPVADPQTAYAWFQRACALETQPETLRDAIAAYQEALRLDPCLAAAHNNLGSLLCQTGRRQEGIDYLERACALDPEQAEIRYNLGNIYEEEGDLELAAAEYRRALRAAPDFADAHYNLALTLERLGSRVQAIQHWKQYLEAAAADDGQPWHEYASRQVQELTDPA